MRRAKNWSLYVFVAVVVHAFLVPYARGADSAIRADSAKKTGAGYLEKISFEKPPGKERVRFSVSKQTEVTVEATQANQIVVRLKDIFVPKGLRRPLKETSFSNVSQVRAVQASEKGRLCAVAMIDLKKQSPYTLHREGLDVFVDFSMASLASAVEQAPLADLQKTSDNLQTHYQKQKSDNDKKTGGEAKMLLDVQDADIKAVFRLLAEQGNVSIVSGDDVKGTVTIYLKDVAWLDALDTILEIKGLSRKIDGNVVKIMTMEKIEAEPLVTRVVKIDYADAAKLTTNLLELLSKDKSGKPKGSVKVDEHSNALIIQATRQDMTRLFPIIEKIDKATPQILIKANIVETTKDTARDLGIRWGGMYGRKVGSQALYVTPGGTGGAAVAPGSAFSGSYSPTSGSAGISGQGFGVNFPATMEAAASGSVGLLFGTIGENILEIQLSALQKDGKLKILSSPSITTLDNQKAFTENGESVPYNTLDESGNTVTKFADAVLRLEIKPNVIDEKNLKMEIIVKKDEVDSSRSVGGNPYIIRKETRTNLIVRDGETIVISGLTKQTKMENVSGVPGLKDIPILGWLFKGEGKSESMEEVLIFITPNILNPAVISGIQGGF